MMETRSSKRSRLNSPVSQKDPEATDNSEKYHDETSNSAQSTSSLVSLETQRQLCLKCNKGGEVLQCSSDTCAFVVHESCLGSTVDMDCEGRFYCPFCAYSRAISEYFEVTKRVTLGRENLRIFLDPEATDNSEKYHDETSNSAQSTSSLLSLETQLQLCWKCNKGGEVLKCSSDTCTFVVHESCLGSTVDRDSEGRYYCPFCANSRAISECLEVTKRATLAREKLTIFLCQKVDNQKLTKGSAKSKIDESKRDDNLSKRNVPNNNRASSTGVIQKSSRLKP